MEILSHLCFELEYWAEVLVLAVCIVLTTKISLNTIDVPRNPTYHPPFARHKSRYPSIDRRIYQSVLHIVGSEPARRD